MIEFYTIVIFVAQHQVKFKWVTEFGEEYISKKREIKTREENY
jgi:hypothetical protein